MPTRTPLKDNKVASYVPSSPPYSPEWISMNKSIEKQKYQFEFQIQRMIDEHKIKDWEDKKKKFSEKIKQHITKREILESDQDEVKKPADEKPTINFQSKTRKELLQQLHEYAVKMLGTFDELLSIED